MALAPCRGTLGRPKNCNAKKNMSPMILTCFFSWCQLSEEQLYSRIDQIDLDVSNDGSAFCMMFVHVFFLFCQAMPGVAIGPADLALLPLPAQEDPSESPKILQFMKLIFPFYDIFYVHYK